MRRALERIDTAVGRVPMVRLVLVCLVVIAVVAVAAAALRVLQLPVGALLAVAVVAVAATWGSSRLLAAATRSRAQDGSALVTGLILFLVLYPSAAPLDLLLVAVAGVAASASKYLLRVGGRHVLNPAAVGLLVVGLTGLTGSAWWVGTPVLLPLVLVSAALIAVRMRLVAPVAVLVVGGAVVQAAALVATGSTPEAAVGYVASTPLLFLAAFMFTEPVTLPPRTWQRIAEAAVVALLLALPAVAPFALGTLRPTPELALLVGNVLAIAVARPAAAGLRLVGSRRLTPTAVEYRFRPERPLPHRAGQYLELHLPHRGADRRGVRRSLTIVSPPASGEVAVAVRMREAGSTFKRALDELPVGGRARAVTVTGGFTLPADRSVPLLLVASGIGITPFVSQLRQDAAEVAAGARPRDLLLVDRVPAADDVPYLQELAATGVRVLVVCPDPEALPPLPDHWHRAAQLDVDTLRSVLPAAPGRVGYVSGSARFIAEARRVLRAAGVRRVRTDALAGY